VAKFRGILDNATHADSIVKEKYQANREAMVLLGKSEAEIVAALPAPGAQSSSASLSPVSAILPFLPVTHGAVAVHIFVVKCT